MKTKLESYAKYMIFFGSLTFVAIGMMWQEHLLVFRKAIKVCLECIGVG